MSDDNPSAALKQVDDFVASVTQKLRDRVVSEACPFCKNLNWFLMDRAEMTSILSSVGVRGLVTYTLVCTNCGFVRQHVRSIINGEITGEVFYDSQ